MPENLFTSLAAKPVVGHLLVAASTGTTTSTKSSAQTTSTSGQYVYLVILGLMVVFYFIFLRPRRQQMRAQQMEARNVSLGDDVVTAGGIVGRVVGLDDTHVRVEVANGVVMTFLRRSVSKASQTGGTAAASAGSGGQSATGSMPDDIHIEDDETDGPSVGD